MDNNIRKYIMSEKENKIAEYTQKMNNEIETIRKKNNLLLIEDLAKMEGTEKLIKEVILNNSNLDKDIIIYKNSKEIRISKDKRIILIDILEKKICIRHFLCSYIISQDLNNLDFYLKYNKFKNDRNIKNFCILSKSQSQYSKILSPKTIFRTIKLLNNKEKLGWLDKEIEKYEKNIEKSKAFHKEEKKFINMVLRDKMIKSLKELGYKIDIEKKED